MTKKKSKVVSITQCEDVSAWLEEQVQAGDVMASMAVVVHKDVVNWRYSAVNPRGNASEEATFIGLLEMLKSALLEEALHGS